MFFILFLLFSFLHVHKNALDEHGHSICVCDYYHEFKVLSAAKKLSTLKNYLHVQLTKSTRNKPKDNHVQVKVSFQLKLL